MYQHRTTKNRSRLRRSANRHAADNELLLQGHHTTEPLPIKNLAQRENLSADAVLALQRTCGNQAVQRLLARTPVAPATQPSIQRKVYIKNKPIANWFSMYHRKKKTTRGDV